LADPDHVLSAHHGDGVGIAEPAVDGDGDLGPLAPAESLDHLVGDDKACGVAVPFEQFRRECLPGRHAARNSLMTGAIAVAATIWFWPSSVLCLPSGRVAAIAFCAFCIQTSDLLPPIVSTGTVTLDQRPAGIGS